MSKSQVDFSHDGSSQTSRKSEKSIQKLYPYGSLELLDTLGKLKAVVSVAGKEITAEFVVICNEGRTILGRKLATELQVLRLGLHVNVV